MAKEGGEKGKRTNMRVEQTALQVRVSVVEVDHLRPDRTVVHYGLAAHVVLNIAIYSVR